MPIDDFSYIIFSLSDSYCVPAVLLAFRIPYASISAPRVGGGDPTVEKYEMAKHNRSREYILLKGDSKAVKKGDIHALTSFTVYKATAKEVEKNLVGMTTVDGVVNESYAAHFID